MRWHQIVGWVSCAFILFVAFGSACAQADPQKGGAKMTVSAGKTVSLQYSLRLEDKAVVKPNVVAEPLTYTHGAQEIMPGLEAALEGMAIGESKQVTVRPAEGYGMVNPEAFLEVSKDRIPTEALIVGAELQGTDPKGKSVRYRVSEVKDKTVILDFNHPLAGKTLYFDVKVLDIK